MKIIIATPSPYARKARVALREKDIDFEEIIDVPWNTDTLTQGINPLGKVPVLLHENNEPLFDSRLIVQYLDSFEPKPLLYPEDPEDNFSARLVETVADGVCDAIVKRQEKKIYEGTKYLSNHLEEKKYFVGDHFNIADICGFSCLEYLDLRFPKFQWRSEYQNLENYWKIHKDRPSFKVTSPTAQIIEPLED
jgi:glutathione S-transferase